KRRDPAGGLPRGSLERRLGGAMAKTEEAAPDEEAKPKPRFETLRAIFLRGDKIGVRYKRLYINGTLVDRKSEGEYVQPAGDIGGPPIAQEFLETNPEGVQYTILQAMPDASADGRAARGPR